MRTPHGGFTMNKAVQYAIFGSDKNPRDCLKIFRVCKLFFKYVISTKTNILLFVRKIKKNVKGNRLFFNLLKTNNY